MQFIFNTTIISTSDFGRSKGQEEVVGLPRPSGDVDIELLFLLLLLV